MTKFVKFSSALDEYDWFKGNTPPRNAHQSAGSPMQEATDQLRAEHIRHQVERQVRQQEELVKAALHRVLEQALLPLQEELQRVTEKLTRLEGAISNSFYFGDGDG